MISEIVSSASRQKRSINGVIVQDEDYPYVVSLHNNLIHYFTSGGTMITRRLVLTAAHCIVLTSHVRVFRHAESMRQNYTIYRKIIHPSFSNSPDNVPSQDIGLLVLNELVEDARVIQLPARNLEVPAGVNATAFGWGRTEQGSYSKDFRKVDLPITYTEPCAMKDEHESRWICADSRNADTCDGDSGGPLVWDNFIVGIVSWGVRNCATGGPSVFTKVAAYRDWIDKYTSEYE
ncbi:hypothetical protein QAD02_010710 [Eretmocerus hayati]|uniref:Uncharacterized protein n=1 Tax=Eretmocerus hayati TaxID=131215 RepID=A0ACC2NV00_9HYME|nr:hypothetical protein QAD02_010710 [Eretmocerus hayati]